VIASATAAAVSGGIMCFTWEQIARSSRRTAFGFARLPTEEMTSGLASVKLMNPSQPMQKRNKEPDQNAEYQRDQKRGRQQAGNDEH
jgi:hypothetical protein